MDIIDYAVQQESYLNESEEVKEQTWADLNRAVGGKKLFMFGTGDGARYFLRRFRQQYPMAGILDNDTRWHGLAAGDVLTDAFETIHEEARIMPVNVLEHYNKEELVVLIASTKYYKEMRKQLLDMGITQSYVLLMMEANRRRLWHDTYEEADGKISKEAYVDSCCRRPIQPNKIVFRSFDTYSDHGKYITEQLLKRNRQLDIVWILRDLREEVAEGVRTVWLKNWKKCIYEMETAKIWVINTLMPQHIRKRESQIYIHTKHWSSITLKKFYLDASTIADVPEEVERWRHNGQCMDYVLTGSRFDTEAFRRGFDFQKEAVQVGSPRTDAMFREEACRRKIMSYYHLEENRKLLLYAPTYRYDRNKTGVHKAQARNIGFDYALIRDALHTKFGGEWEILLRLHPSVAQESDKFAEGSYVVDVSAYPDSEELASACDVMISDYSSIMFEPAYVKKPVILYTTDREEYIDHEYDLLLDYDTLPFPMAESDEELVQCIMDFDRAAYENWVTAFLNRYGVQEDGHASERAAAFILGLLRQNR